MGLSGRKVKQRIGHDPRNLSWADDANKFGAAYLQKLGWSAGTGLGTSGEGRTSHIKVHQKLDMMGIGAAHQKDPNGIAWKQARDFESLLKRLNGESPSSTPVDGFVQAGEEEESIEGEREKGEDIGRLDETNTSKKNKKDKKRKKSKDDDESEEPVKKRKKSRTEGNGDSDDESKRSSEKQKKRKVKPEDERVEEIPAASTSQPTPQAVVPRPHRAHRARFLAAKRMALSSSAAVDEILGVSRSTSGTPLLSASIPGTPADTQGDLKLQELTTSSKSVMDYFKEKLLAKSSSKAASASMVASPLPEQTSSQDDYDDYSHRPRGGLGLGASRGLGSSLRLESTYEEETETQKTGLGASSRMSAMFAAASSFVGASGDVKITEERAVALNETIDISSKAEEMPKEKAKKEKKHKGVGKTTQEDERKRRS
ncbi:unnamed protein product [Somion occarium]|uniref:PinX1-related protein 1 n=1 Tax=Somion occarium TaxID=3059160 RepID=A0ABP1DVR2_9APHY